MTHDPLCSARGWGVGEGFVEPDVCRCKEPTRWTRQSSTDSTHTLPNRPLRPCGLYG